MNKWLVTWKDDLLTDKYHLKAYAFHLPTRRANDGTKNKDVDSFNTAKISDAFGNHQYHIRARRFAFSASWKKPILNFSSPSGRCSIRFWHFLHSVYYASRLGKQANFLALSREKKKVNLMEDEGDENTRRRW